MTSQKLIHIFPKEQQLNILDRRQRHVCITCAQPFTDANVYTALGWKETKISGMCEECFDDLFAVDIDADKREYED